MPRWTFSAAKWKTLEQMLDIDLSAWKSAGSEDAELPIEELAPSETSTATIHNLRKAEIPDQAA